MLPKKNRFTRAAFTAFATRADLRTAYNKLGTLKYRPGGHTMAVVTSSKHEKHAVARNRLRRRLYQHFAFVKAPYTGILYASKQSYAMGPDEQRALFDNLLAHAAKSGK